MLERLKLHPASLLLEVAWRLRGQSSLVIEGWIASYYAVLEPGRLLLLGAHPNIVAFLYRDDWRQQALNLAIGGLH